MINYDKLRNFGVPYIQTNILEMESIFGLSTIGGLKSCLISYKGIRYLDHHTTGAGFFLFSCFFMFSLEFHTSNAYKTIHTFHSYCHDE